MYVAQQVADATIWRSPGTVRHSSSLVPPLIDNLWEWKRPAWFPSRRFSTFASPTIKMALRKANDPETATLYHIALPVGSRVAQLTNRRGRSYDTSDARFHPDVETLQRLLAQSLGPEWAGRRLRGKAKSGLLWVPCLFKEEIDALFRHVPELARIHSRIWNAISFWSDVRIVETLDEWPDPHGEIFFECREGYWAEPVRRAGESKIAKLGLFARILGEQAHSPAKADR